MDELLRTHFQTFGYVVLRSAFDAAKLRAEVLVSLEVGTKMRIDTAVATVRYLPMMCARTPESLSLLDTFQPLAESLLEGTALPVRAKGMQFFAVLYAST